MVITDKYLEEMAKAAAGSTFDTLNYFSVGETVAVIGTTTAVLPGEVGSRKATSVARTDNVIEFTATRLATDVVDTIDGDDIKTFGSNVASSGSDLLSGVSVAGVTHTTAFDLDLILTVSVVR